MTNEKALLQLINASIALGAAGRTNIVVQLSPTYLPENVLKKARDVLGRMRPDTEVGPHMIAPDGGGEMVELLPDGDETPTLNRLQEAPVCPVCSSQTVRAGGIYRCSHCREEIGRG